MIERVTNQSHPRCNTVDSIGTAPAPKPLFSVDARTWLSKSEKYQVTRRHLEHHHVDRVGWLRAAVLGADDGLLSTASLIIGVAAAQPSRAAILIAGAAGLLAGSLSMAAGEYVSVSSQHDAETADLKREAAELEADPKAEVAELTAIYIARGLDPALAVQVAEQLMVRDALGAHARDELGISDSTRARPLQAALASAASFAIGAAAPLALAAVTPLPVLVASVAIATLAFLALLGAVGARIGGSPIGVGVLRVTFWGAVAMAVTATLGHAFGSTV